MGKKDKVSSENEEMLEFLESIEDEEKLEEDMETIVEEVSETSEMINEKIKEFESLNLELKDKLQRNLAEFDNYRKRTDREKTLIYGDGVKDTVEKLLPVIDNFERAIQSFESKEDGVYKGFEMIFKQIKSFLTDLGIEEIKAVGEKFDPKYHFAVAHVSDDNYSENEVIEELQKGYIYNDRIVRCSMVRVAN